MKRESGFYWIKHNRRDWMVAFWDGGCWYETKSRYSIPDPAILNINEERILPPQN